MTPLPTIPELCDVAGAKSDEVWARQRSTGRRGQLRAKLGRRPPHGRQQYYQHAPQGENGTASPAPKAARGKDSAKVGNEMSDTGPMKPRRRPSLPDAADDGAPCRNLALILDDDDDDDSDDGGMENEVAVGTEARGYAQCLRLHQLEREREQEQELWDRQYETSVLLNAYTKVMKRSRGFASNGIPQNDEGSESSSSTRSSSSSLSLPSFACAELVMISGEAGIGKTSLACSLSKRVHGDGGWFVSTGCAAASFPPLANQHDSPAQLRRSSGHNQTQKQQDLPSSASLPYTPFFHIFEQLIDICWQSQQHESGVAKQEQRSGRVEAPATRTVSVSSATRLQHQLSVSISATDQRVLVDAFPPFQRLFPAATTMHDRSQQGSAEFVVGTTVKKAFLRFLQAFGEMHRRPLVLLFDDIQWIDMASLELLREILHEECGQLLILATCNNQAQNALSPVELVDELSADDMGGHCEEQEAQIKHIELHGISLGALTSVLSKHRLVRDHMLSSRKHLHHVASSLMQKTQGNPFWISQWFRRLAMDDEAMGSNKSNGNSSTSNWDKKHLQQKPMSGCQWNGIVADVFTQSISSDDIVKSSVEALAQNSTVARQVLQVASNLGKSFHVEDLSAIMEKLRNDKVDSEIGIISITDDKAANRSLAESQISSVLVELVSVGVLRVAQQSPCRIESQPIRFEQDPLSPLPLPLHTLLPWFSSNAVCTLLNNDQSTTAKYHSGGANIIFEWTHDKFQEEASRLIPEDRRLNFRIMIVKSLLSKLEDTNSLELLTSPAVFHLFSSRHLAPPDQSHEANMQLQHLVAAIFYGAGKFSSKMERDNCAHAYFESARSILFASSRRLPSNPWLDYGGKHHRLALDIMTSLAATKFVLRDFASVKDILQTIIKSSRTLEDRLPALELQVWWFITQDRFDEAISTGVAVLADLGYDVKARKVSNSRRFITTAWNKALAKANWGSFISSKHKTDARNLDGAFDAIYGKGSGQVSPSFPERRRKGRPQGEVALRVVHAMSIPVIICQRKYSMMMLQLADMCLNEIVLNEAICAESSIAFLLYGIVLCQPHVGLFREGSECGRLAVAISSQSGTTRTSNFSASTNTNTNTNTSLQRYVEVMNESYCQPYGKRGPIAACTKPLDIIQTESASSIEVAAILLHHRGLDMLLNAGMNLPQILHQLNKGRDIIMRQLVRMGRSGSRRNVDTTFCALPSTLQHLDMMRHAVACLLEGCKQNYDAPMTSDQLTDEHRIVFDQDVASQHYDKVGDEEGHLALLFWQSYVSFQLGRYDDAHGTLTKIHSLCSGGLGSLLPNGKVKESNKCSMSCGHMNHLMRLSVVFMDTLSTIIVDKGRSSTRLKGAMKLLERMNEACRGRNVKGKLLLCQAELAAQRNRPRVAIQKYDELLHGDTRMLQAENAILLTRLAIFQMQQRRRHSSNNAISNMLVGRTRWHQQQRREADATNNLIEARRMYQEWGCRKKAISLTKLILHVEHDEVTTVQRNSYRVKEKTANNRTRTCRTDIASSLCEEGATGA